jgi:hypothetical protein
MYDAQLHKFLQLPLNPASKHSIASLGQSIAQKLT